MSLFDKIFGGRRKKQEVGNRSDSRRLPTFAEFPTLIPEERMKVIMILGDSGNVEYFPFIKYAIQEDPDINVKFAALKRIHRFKNVPETESILTGLKGSGEGQKLEPYFSMALSRVGLITIQELEAKLNNSK